MGNNAMRPLFQVLYSRLLAPEITITVKNNEITVSYEQECTSQISPNSYRLFTTYNLYHRYIAYGQRQCRM